MAISICILVNSHSVCGRGIFAWECGNDIRGHGLAEPEEDLAWIWVGVDRVELAVEGDQVVEVDEINQEVAVELEISQLLLCETWNVSGVVWTPTWDWGTDAWIKNGSDFVIIDVYISVPPHRSVRHCEIPYRRLTVNVVDSCIWSVILFKLLLDRVDL